MAKNHHSDRKKLKRNKSVADKEKARESKELDRELETTFPASDSITKY